MGRRVAVVALYSVAFFVAAHSVEKQGNMIVSVYVHPCTCVYISIHPSIYLAFMLMGSLESWLTSRRKISKGTASE